ncbi:MAG: hypothetical protein LC104_17500 [Bacteroidales bacterium]|nr:hypothetical protein [Bacteroidales bacterium]
MGTLGKILLVFNLFAAGGVAFVATQDWAKRQEVTGTAVRFQLHVQGLPLAPLADGSAAPANADTVPLAVDMPGSVRIESVTPKLLQSYFQGADGGAMLGDNGKPPANQIEEVRRVKEKISAMLTQASPNQKLELLCGRALPDGSFVPGWLVRLAESFEERDLIRRLANPKTGNIPGITTADQAGKLVETILLNRFDSVLNAPNAQLAQEQAEETAKLAQAVAAATTPVKSALTDLDTATDAYNTAGNAAIAKPQDPTAQETYKTTATRLQEATEQVRIAGEKLQEARRPLYEALTRPTVTAARDESDRRHRAAHLLMFLEPSSAWQQRVVRVVGLKQYQSALSEQAGRLTDMTWALEQLIRADQGMFTAEYEQLKQLARTRQGILDQQVAVTAGLADQNAKDNEILKQRQLQRDQRRDILSALRKQVEEQLAAQATVEQKLFEVQQRVGQSLIRNFELEEKLGVVERQVLQGRKPN